MTVGANAATGSVAKILGAGHRAGHARRMQDTLATHLAIKEELLAEVFCRPEPAVNPVVTDKVDEGLQPGKQTQCNLVNDLQEMGVSLEPATAIHRRSEPPATLCS